MRVLWLGRPLRWGPWMHSAAYRWIFDIGPVRVLRETDPSSRKDGNDAS